MGDSFHILSDLPSGEAILLVVKTGKQTIMTAVRPNFEGCTIGKTIN